VAPGDLWFNTINGQLYAWYSDGSSTQWVSISKVGPAGPQGPKGDVGPASTIPGPQGLPGADSTVPGPVGPQGPKGDQGIQGVVGPAAGFATPQITTLAPGASATVSATGPDYSKQFLFGIPQGTKGDQGPKGDKGDPVTVGTGTALPLTPDDGDLFYDTTTSKLKIFITPASGTGSWVNIN
jgi:hypothetical protein